MTSELCKYPNVMEGGGGVFVECVYHSCIDYWWCKILHGGSIDENIFYSNLQVLIFFYFYFDHGTKVEVYTVSIKGCELHGLVFTNILGKYLPVPS